RIWSGSSDPGFGYDRETFPWRYDETLRVSGAPPHQSPLSGGSLGWRIAMPSPFPGMDPYLESPEIFPDFHDSFITYLRETLQANLPAPYFAALGRRVWIEVSRRSIGPDLEVRRGHAASPRRAEPAGATAVADLPIARPVVVKVAHEEFREPFIEIYTRGEEGKRLVASIEVLSLANKTPGEHGRDLYWKKQNEML